MATSYFNNFQLQQNKLPGMGMYGLPPFYGDFYGKFISRIHFEHENWILSPKMGIYMPRVNFLNSISYQVRPIYIKYAHYLTKGLKIEFLLDLIRHVVFFRDFFFNNLTDFWSSMPHFFFDIRRWTKPSRLRTKYIHLMLKNGIRVTIGTSFFSK